MKNISHIKPRSEKEATIREGNWTGQGCKCAQAGGAVRTMRPAATITLAIEAETLGRQLNRRGRWMRLAYEPWTKIWAWYLTLTLTFSALWRIHLGWFPSAASKVSNLWGGGGGHDTRFSFHSWQRWSLALTMWFKLPPTTLQRHRHWSNHVTRDNTSDPKQGNIFPHCSEFEAESSEGPYLSFHNSKISLQSHGK